MAALAVKKTREQSTSGAEGRAEVDYIIFDALDVEEAKAAVMDEAEQTYDGLELQSVTCERVTDETAHGIVWEATVYYGRFGGTMPQEGSILSFDIGTASQHITQSRETIWKGSAAGADEAPDHKGAIGVRGEDVEGVDILVPVHKWSETHFLDPDDFTHAYRRTLAGLTAKVNDASFRGHEAGEVLFVGATARQALVPGAKVEITFHFAHSPNAESISIAGITVPEKKGHEYLWLQFASELDTSPTAPALATRPKYAYVERVYEAADFADLGIGTA